MRSAALAAAAAGIVVALVAVAPSRASQDAPRLAPVVVVAPRRLEPVLVTPAGSRPARRPFDRARNGEPLRVLMTAYCLRGTTRRGRYVRDGIVAADPRVFPLSRYLELYVGDRYLGRFLVDDTGKKIKGTHLDIWMASCDEARQWGARWGTAVLVPRDRETQSEPRRGNR
ncbi:MAG TPA: 3D domain-containing protein [Gemmatimonadaceae bacterium]|nr:3D domain-containing protein [Gemmatimonadaceae bacterium]